jgi:hypothetical protein
VFALLAGLNNTAVSRLKLTWERLSRKHMRRYKDMMAVVCDAKNHSSYRQELLKARPPVVPYLGNVSLSPFPSLPAPPPLIFLALGLAALFSKDLFGVEESNPTLTSDGLVNFGKMRLIAKLIGDFTACQVRLAACVLGIVVDRRRLTRVDIIYIHRLHSRLPSIRRCGPCSRDSSPCRRTSSTNARTAWNRARTCSKQRQRK